MDELAPEFQVQIELTKGEAAEILNRESMTSRILGLVYLSSLAIPATVLLYLLGHWNAIIVGCPIVVLLSVWAGLSGSHIPAYHLRPKTISLTHEGLHYAREDGWNWYWWSSVLDVQETDRLVLFSLTKKKHFLVVPKSAFHSTEDRECFVEFAKSSMLQSSVREANNERDWKKRDGEDGFGFVATFTSEECRWHTVLFPTSATAIFVVSLLLLDPSNWPAQIISVWVFVLFYFNLVIAGHWVHLRFSSQPEISLSMNPTGFLIREPHRKSFYSWCQVRSIERILNEVILARKHDYPKIVIPVNAIEDDVDDFVSTVKGFTESPEQTT